MSDLPELIRWEANLFAEAAYLGGWYIGALYEADSTHFVMRLDLPDKGHQRTPHGTREGAKAFAEQRVREFLAHAQLPGRI